MGALKAWKIHLSGWIIEDGNYRDFAVGQTAEFAVEFWLRVDSSVNATSSEIGVESVDSEFYRATAEVIAATGHLTILNIGILAYSYPAPSFAGFGAGARIRGEVGLGVDPFDYFETLATDQSIPPMIYTWRIVDIQRQTAPFIESAHSKGAAPVRDPSKVGYVSAERTNAWTDVGKDGIAEYLLTCELLPFPPKRTSSTAF
jgi:hypothetical protein